ncbi:MAG: radical SAM protein, partial [Clostridia bacterium]|nr:radical SAM protein [Clostridia bacterium]
MNLTLHLTADCNLRCRYCYETHCKARMTWDTARQAVDLVFSYGHETNVFSLFGGEPLLERYLAERLCRYAKDEARRRGVSVR